MKVSIKDWFEYASQRLLNYSVTHCGHTKQSDTLAIVLRDCYPFDWPGAIALRSQFVVQAINLYLQIHSKVTQGLPINSGRTLSSFH